MKLRAIRPISPLLHLRHSPLATTPELSSKLSSAKTRRPKHLAAQLFSVVAVLGLFGVAAAATQTESPAQHNDKSQTPTTKLEVTSGQSDDTTPPSNSVTTDPEGSISTQTTVTGNADNQSNAHVSVTVNGQSVPVPTNGTSQQTITTPGGPASVSISNTQSADGSSYNTSFTTTTNSTFQNSSVNTNDSSTETYFGSP